MEYRVVESDYMKAVENAVNKLIAEGWKPLGGIAVVLMRGEYCYYYQAMIKEP